jgi:acyl-CoA hydrolase
VAIDDQGRPVKVERWEPQTEEDVALEQYAKRLMKLRKGIDEEMRLHRGT